MNKIAKIYVKRKYKIKIFCNYKINVNVEYYSILSIRRFLFRIKNFESYFTKFSYFIHIKQTRFYFVFKKFSIILIFFELIENLKFDFLYIIMIFV